MAKEIRDFNKEELIQALKDDELYGIYENASEELKRDKDVALVAVTMNSNNYY